MARLCLVAAHEAMSTATCRKELGGAVFASSSSDLQMAHKICTAAGLPGHPVSPTDFLNSVHNAASGYWSIAARQHVPTNNITSGEMSFAAGLLEAAVMLKNCDGEILLVCFEWLPPPPLGHSTKLKSGGAVAVLLSAEVSGWQLEITPESQPETHCSQAGLETLRLENPAMRAIPFLQLLCGTDSRVVLPYINGQTLQISRKS